MAKVVETLPLVKHVLLTALVDGVDLLPLAALVPVKDQTLEYVMEKPGSTTLVLLLILAQTALVSAIAKLVSIMTPIACGVALLLLVKNGEHL